MERKDQAATASGTTGPDPAADLRQRAEAALRAKAEKRPPPSAPPSVEAMQQALHDLEVHQIELEMQNEELRRALAELESSQARYFDFYDLAPVGYCTLSDTGLIVQANLSTAKLLGYPRSALVGQRFTKFIHPEQQDTYYKLRHRVLESGEIEFCELRLRTNDDQFTWIYLQAIAASDEAGVQQVRMVLSDINKQHAQSEQLQLQALVLDQIPSQVAITDLNGMVTYLNRAGMERRSQNGDGFMGQHVSQYVDGLKGDATQQEIAAATLAHGSWKGTVVNPLADGSNRTYQLHTTLVRDESGSPVAMVGVAADITPRLQLEQALRQREQYTRALLDNFPFEVWLKDHDGRYLAVNQTVATQHGWPSTQSLVGKRFEDIADPALVKSALEYEQQVIAAGSASHAEFLLPIRGEARWHEVYVAPVVMEGNLIGTVGYSRDISDRRAQEEQLRLQATVLDQIQDRVTITDIKGSVIYLNQAGRQHVELVAEEQQLGQHVSDYGNSPLADAPHEEIIHTTLTQGSWQGKVGHVRANGSNVFYSLRTTLVRDSSGTPIAMVGVGTDITHQLALEQELRQNGVFMRAMLDNFPFKVWLKDLDGRYLMVNEVLARLHGWPSAQSLLGKTVSDITDAESSALANVHEQSIISSGRSFMSEHQFTNQGQPIWVETYKSPVVVDGKIVGTVGYSRDISERRQQEEKLRLQALVLDQIQDTVNITDLNGIVVYINQAGIEKAAHAMKVSGQHVSSYGNSAQADATHEQVLATTREQGHWRGTIGHARNDGSVLLYDVRTTLVKDESGKPIAMVGVGTDITRQLALEKELRQREAYQRAILDNFPFQVWLKGLDSRYLAVNHALAAMHDWPSATSLVGKRFADLVDAASAEKALAQEQEVMASGESHVMEILLPVRGEQRWFETYKAPIVMDGQLIGTVGYARDITERKQIESELLAAKDEAMKANQAKSHFLAAASHDLRQPIFALTLFFGSLKTRLHPHHGELLAKIETCIESLSEMLTGLLDVSKLEAGVIVPTTTDFSVDELLRKLLATHGARAHSAGLRLRWRNSGLVGHSDPVLLGRIVGNLLDNAIRHTRQGGVLIACRRRDGRHWIEIWDTGIGIAQDKLGFIFQAFSRLDEAAQIRGSGLGLAIVDKTAALLGLQIRVRSQPGRGSLFAIELPLGQRLPPAQQTSRRYLTQRLRIALVEDDNRVLDALIQVLEDAGHELIVASSGKALIDALGRRAPDIIVSDYRLVGTETGYDVIEISRKIFGNDLPALLITGDTDPALVLSMSRRGIQVLYKPLKFESLQDAIRDAVDARRAAKP